MRYILLSVIIVFSANFTFAAEGPFLKQGDFEAFVSDSFSCNAPSFVIRSSSEESFKDDITELEQFVGLLRIELSSECPRKDHSRVLDRIQVTGEVNGKTVYAAKAKVVKKKRVRRKKGEKRSRPTKEFILEPVALPEQSAPRDISTRAAEAPVLRYPPGDRKKFLKKKRKAAKDSSAQSPAPDVSVPAPSADDKTAPQSAEMTGAKAVDIWRFKLTCGKEITRGFFELDINGDSAQAVFESFTKYPNVGFLKTAGSFNRSSNDLTLKSVGFIEGKSHMTPVDISATLSADGYSISGSATGAQSCASFTARKTSFDTRRSNSGVITGNFSDSLRPSSFYETATQLTVEECEKFINWYAGSIVLKTPDGSISSVLVDSDTMLDVLGFTYDAMKGEDDRAFTQTNQVCRKTIQQSANTEHAQLMSKYMKVAGNASPAIIAREGRVKKSRGQPNYYWYQNMYIATSIRDASILLDRQYNEMKALPRNLSSLNSISAALRESQSRNGFLAALPQKDRQKHIANLQAIQNDIASKAVGDKIADIDWSGFTPTIEGIKALNRKQNETKASFGNTLPAAGIKLLDDVFARNRIPLSGQLADRIIASFPGVPVSLAGLRNFKKTKTGYTARYQPVLIPADLSRVTGYLDKSFAKTVNDSSGLIASWLEKEVPSAESGLAVLDNISRDILGMGVKATAGGKYPANMRTIAKAIEARYQQIKVDECIVPEGFEEMREVICPGS